jgi:hypothetical protein
LLPISLALFARKVPKQHERKKDGKKKDKGKRNKRSRQ